MTMLAQERRVWRLALAASPTPLSIITIVLIIAAAIGAAVGIFVWKDLFHGILRGAGNPLSALAAIHWALFMSGAAAQNKPANARLVPGMTRSVRRAAVLAWMVTMAPFAGIGLVHPQGAMVVLSASVLVTAFGLYRAGCERFAALAVLAGIVYLWLPGQAVISEGVLAACGAASLLFAAWALERAFPRGGDRHFAMLDKQLRAQALDTMDGTAQMARKGAQRRGLYGVILRHDLAARDSMKLLMHGLGPNFQAPLLRLAMAGLAALTGIGVVRLAGLASQPDELARLFCITLLIGVVFSWYRFAAGILGAGSEQALVRMAPAMPRAPRLNRLLGKRILQACALEWLGAVVLMGGALLVLSISESGFMMAAAFGAAILPLVSLSLGDYSGKSRFSFDGVIVATFLCLLVAFVSIFWVHSIAVWLALMASILGLAAACISIRWHCMIAAPPALPALRLT